MNIARIMELKYQGYCCSQIIMQMGLEGIGKENEDLITAMKGLCDGVYCGEICGTLSAASCLLYLIGKDQAGELYDELRDWFLECYGSLKCNDIIEGNPLKKSVICGDLVENTYLKLAEMFEDRGIPFQAISV